MISQEQLISFNKLKLHVPACMTYSSKIIIKNIRAVINEKSVELFINFFVHMDLHVLMRELYKLHRTILEFSVCGLLLIGSSLRSDVHCICYIVF